MEACCRLCGASFGPACGSKRLLGKYDVSYFRCSACDLVQTETPTWLDESYEEALSELDTGSVLRAEECRHIVSLVAGILPVSEGALCLDYGGGYGLFVRMMRDRGYDFRWADKHGSNLFAGGFEGDIAYPGELVTCFEVFEHLSDVGSELRRFFDAHPPYLLVGTVLHDGWRDDWFYLFTKTGQHIAFYSERTMRFIADRFGYRVTVTPLYTLFVRNDIELPSWRTRWLAKVLAFPYSRIARLSALWLGRRRRAPLTNPDHDLLASRPIQGTATPLRASR